MIGSIVFMVMFSLDWVDAVYTAVLITSGINIEVTPTTDGGKIFVIIYCIVSVIILLSMAKLRYNISLN